MTTGRADSPTAWLEAMTRYTHGDPTAIHHLARDADFLTELPEQVQVLQLTSRHRSDGRIPY